MADLEHLICVVFRCDGDATLFEHQRDRVEATELEVAPAASKEASEEGVKKGTSSSLTCTTSPHFIRIVQFLRPTTIEVP